MTMFERILPYARKLVARAVAPGDAVVDATMGNGHDTLFLAGLVEGTHAVYAYDVQQEALTKTRERLRETGLLDRVLLLHKGHETADAELAGLQKPLAAVMFNLGYLPGGDHSLTTRPETTIEALGTFLRYLKPGGLATLVVYTGHEGGKRERDQLMRMMTGLDSRQFDVLRYEWLNRDAPPFLLAIHKRP